MLRAIAQPARFRIVKLLAKRGECVCGDLVDELPLAQSTVSEHLKVLKDAGIVRGAIDGPNKCYCLEPKALAWLQREFAALSESYC
jgi:ArsR family transcriptional regulator